MKLTLFNEIVRISGPFRDGWLLPEGEHCEVSEATGGGEGSFLGGEEDVAVEN